jgi:hypothetical protein
MTQIVPNLAASPLEVAPTQSAAPFEAALKRATQRSPEEIEADRLEILKTARPARPLPAGKTLCDVVQGTWPGTETDEEIHDMLEKLS